MGGSWSGNLAFLYHVPINPLGVGGKETDLTRILERDLLNCDDAKVNFDLPKVRHQGWK